MFTLQISYPVRDYEAFKKVFDTRSRRPRRLRRPGCPLVPGYRGPEQRGRAP